MTIAIRNYVIGTDTGGSATVSADTAAGTGTTPQSGDVVVCIHRNDYYTLANMVAPTGGPTWSLITGGTVDGGTNVAHIKSYIGVLGSSGDFTVSTTETGSHDEDKVLEVWVLSGADTSTPVDVANGGFGSASTQTVPSMSPTSTDGYLICSNGSGGGATAPSYTSPSGMTELYEVHSGGISGAAAYLQLSSSGATGAKDFTASTSTPYAAVGIVIKTASGGATQDIVVPLLATSSTVFSPLVDNRSITIPVVVTSSTVFLPTVVSLLQIVEVPVVTTSSVALSPTVTGGVVANVSISDQARTNMLSNRGLVEPRRETNTDLMFLVLEDGGQVLVTETDATAATHLLRYMMSLRS